MMFLFLMISFNKDECDSATCQTHEVRKKNDAIKAKENRKKKEYVQFQKAFSSDVKILCNGW